MWSRKTPEQIKTIHEAGAILAAILRELAAVAKPGMQTQELSKRAAEMLREHGVKPGFLNYHGYPDVICLSVNEQAVHTPGSDYVLQEGDLLKLDFGVVKGDLNSDAAMTVLVASNPDAPEFADKRRQMQVTREALEKGIAQCRVGKHLGDVSHAIGSHIEKNGFTVVKELGGHGIGRKLHEEPWIANFGEPGTGPELTEGMVVALEPITSNGGWQVKDGADGFTYEMKDGSLSAHFEHTVAITADGPKVLTL